MQARLFLTGVTLLLSQLPLPAFAAGQTGAVMSAAPATAPTALTLAQAVDLALAANPQLRSAAQDAAIAQAGVQQAGLLPNPELSLLREGMRRGNRTDTVQLNQSIELGGKRAARRAVAESEFVLALGEQEIARIELRADVIAAYLDALGTQERVELAEASLQLAGKARAAAAKRVQAGRISPVEQTRSNVAEASARLELNQAVAERERAKRRLAALWGSTAAPDQPLVVPKLDLDTIPGEAQVLAWVDNAPQMVRVRRQLERDRAQVTLEKTQRIPDVTLTVGRQKDDQMDRAQTIVGLSVPLPLFNRNQGNLLAALRRVDKTEIAVERERVALTQAVTDARERAVVADAELATLRAEVLPAAQSAFEAATTGFELGKFAFLDVLDAQRTLVQVRAQYSRALGERYRAFADLQRYGAVPRAAQ